MYVTYVNKHAEFCFQRYWLPNTIFVQVWLTLSYFLSDRVYIYFTPWTYSFSRFQKLEILWMCIPWIKAFCRLDILIWNIPILSPPLYFLAVSNSLDCVSSHHRRTHTSPWMSLIPPSVSERDTCTSTENYSKARPHYFWSLGGFDTFGGLHLSVFTEKTAWTTVCLFVVRHKDPQVSFTHTFTL